MRRLRYPLIAPAPDAACRCVKLLSGMANLRYMMRVLQRRDFRLLWLAQTASVVGDRIVLVALALLVIDLTGSATDLGLVLAAQSLPLVTFLLIGGVWADRLPRHLVMVATDIVRFALHALLAALIFTGQVSVWRLVVIEAVFGTAEAFFRPAATGLLPQTVPDREIQPANALVVLSENVAEFAGPALATALVLGAGAGWAFSLDAATFLVSAGLLVQVRPRLRLVAPGQPASDEPPGAVSTASGTPAQGAIAAQSAAGAPAARGGFLREVREGSREVRARTWVWVTLAAFCAALFVGLAPWFVLGPVVARIQYGHIGIYGVVVAAEGVGMITGSLVGIGWRPRYPMRLAMLAMLIWPAGAVLYAVGATLLAVLPLSVLGGTGIALFNVWWTTALAERIPPALLSRVSAYDWMASYALLPAGYLLAGPIASQLGSVNVLVGGSLLSLLALAAGLLPRETRMLSRLRAAAPPAI